MRIESHSLPASRLVEPTEGLGTGVAERVLAVHERVAVAGDSARLALQRARALLANRGTTSAIASELESLGGVTPRLTAILHSDADLAAAHPLATGFEVSPELLVVSGKVRPEAQAFLQQLGAQPLTLRATASPPAELAGLIAAIRAAAPTASLRLLVEASEAALAAARAVAPAVAVSALVATAAEALNAAGLAERCDSFTYALDHQDSAGAEAVRVAQYIAGPRANAFPAALRSQHLTADQALLAAQTQLGELVLPAATSASGLLDYLEMRLALRHAVGHHVGLDGNGKGFSALVTRAAAPEDQGLVARLERTLGALDTLPVPVAQHHLLEDVSLLVRQSGRHLRELAERFATGRATASEVAAQRPLYELYFWARYVRDNDRLLAAIGAEVSVLRERAASAGVDVAQKLDEASVALGQLEGALQNMLRQRRESFHGERAAASHAWEALRAIEASRQVVDRVVPPTLHAQRTRLRYRNDEWDNNAYTATPPRSDEPYGAYLKRVSRAFLDDQGLETVLVGKEHIPVDRPVVYALTHRSGAIDRFVTMSALPIDDDAFMYLVKAGSPLDNVAKLAYGEGNRWIVPADPAAKSALDVMRRIAEGFARGARALVLYPEGVGSIGGEVRSLTPTAVVAAARAGAVVVPVTLEDPLRAEPGVEGRIVVRAHPAIDPRSIAAQLDVDPGSEAVLRVASDLLRFRLASGYQSMV